MKIKLIIPIIFIACLISCAVEKHKRQEYNVTFINGDDLELRDSLRSKRHHHLKRGRHKGRFWGQIFGGSKTTIRIDSTSTNIEKQ